MSKPTRPRHILFGFLGNICRSSLVARRSPDFRARSLVGGAVRAARIKGVGNSMGSVIKISVGTTWGSAFCIDEPDGRVFYTAAHVLKDISLGSLWASGPVQLCDERMYSPSTFVLSVTSFDARCDLGTFTCDFPAMPFRRCPRPPEGTKVAVNGYLFMPGGSMPDCGVETVLEGPADTFVDHADCGRGFVHLGSGEPELPGMSGSPVSPSGDRAYAFGLLNGAPTDNGGPPFNFTFI